MKKYRIIHSLYGGNFKITEQKSADFLDTWTKIDNSGQHNCGIYVRQNHILKCDLGINNIEDVGSINKQYKIFPEIYEIHKLNDKYYIEMEKLDGDVTNLLLTIVPKLVLDEINNITQSIKDDILYLFRHKTPSTMSWYFYPLKNIKYDDETKTYYYNGYDDAKNIWHRVNISDNNNDPVKTKFDEIVNRLQKSELTEAIYSDFIHKLNKQIILILPEIQKQIFILKKLLIDNKYTYSDNKYDNFGFLLKDTKENYFGFDLERNKVGKKYFYLRILDWESGLSKINNNYIETEKKRIIYDFNNNILYSINGQYSLENINYMLFNTDVNLKNYFSQDITKILNTKYSFEFGFNNTSYNTVDEVVKNINYISIIDTIIEKLPGKYIISEKDEEKNSYIIIKSGSGKNNSVRIKITDNLIMITYLDDNGKINTKPIWNWIVGSVETGSIDTAVKLIDAAYS